MSQFPWELVSHGPDNPQARAQVLWLLLELGTQAPVWVFGARRQWSQVTRESSWRLEGAVCVSGGLRHRRGDILIDFHLKSRDCIRPVGWQGARSRMQVLGVSLLCGC